MNDVTLIGVITKALTYNHHFRGENYYSSTISIERESGTVDYVPVIIPERLIQCNYYGRYVGIKGCFRSYKAKDKMLLYVLVNRIEEVDHNNINDIFIEGVINKPPTYRFTPYGREISDVIVAVNRDYGKCDYIPCVAWGLKARLTSSLTVGSSIRVVGRIQSREYIKNGETKIAYEVSANYVESD